MATQEWKTLSVEERAARGKAAAALTGSPFHARGVVVGSTPAQSAGTPGRTGANSSARSGSDPLWTHGGDRLRLLPGWRLPHGCRSLHRCANGSDVQLCGDSHLLNFGGFASPERDLIFDVNDFDETNPGPFEWDVKRLATSLDVVARSRNVTAPLRTRMVATLVRSYREAIREFAGMRHLDIWYSRLDAPGIIARWGNPAGGDAVVEFQRTVTKARTKDRLKAAAKLTHAVDGEIRFVSDPPLIVPVEEVYTELGTEQIEDMIREVLRSYRHSLPGDRRHLLDAYRFAHLARKVVGVGSVGTEAWVALMLGRDNDDPLFLQIKEAQTSVLEHFLGKSSYTNHGQRVVEGQRLMQAATDIFLGWAQVTESDGAKRDFYMRQLWDWKASADISSMTPELLTTYGQICGWTLARAHARTGDGIAIGSYLGESDGFDRAITEFAASYADQNTEDHRALVDAIAAGTVAARSDV